MEHSTNNQYENYFYMDSSQNYSQYDPEDYEHPQELLGATLAQSLLHTNTRQPTPFKINQTSRLHNRSLPIPQDGSNSDLTY